MLTFTSDTKAGFLEFIVDGTIERAEYEAVVKVIDEMLKTRERIDVVEIVRNIGWIEPEVWWKDLVFHLGHRRFLRRAAIVSDKGWIGPVIRVLAPFYPAAMRVFPESQLETARLWAREADAPD